jgi:hypothetical protein
MIDRGSRGSAPAHDAARRPDVGAPLHIVLRCADAVLPKVRYVFDTLLMTRNITIVYASEPPPNGPWLLYGADVRVSRLPDRCLALAHCPVAWHFFDARRDDTEASLVDGLPVVFPGVVNSGAARPDIAFDIAANAFYFLSSWSERVAQPEVGARRMHADSVFARLQVPQDIVDRYLARLLHLLDALCDRLRLPRWGALRWPQGADYALVLSHDVDFVPSGAVDIAVQGAKTMLRHLITQRDPVDATRAAVGLGRALLQMRDPYGCIPEIIRRERQLGVAASFQVAVARRHPADVNYRIEDDRVRDYLRHIPDAGFDLCLHGSYRSTENPEWYAEEVELLARRLGRPHGSRQHYLSFEYDTLFAAQEQAGIEYDMSMGYPDLPGPRAGFSFPYFPYCLDEDRPYDVLQISLFLMDVTLRSYLGLKGVRAWDAMTDELDALRDKGGCVSCVWHPIVFGGARDPGFDELFWAMVERVGSNGGVATDGRTISRFWRERARRFPSFSRDSPCRSGATALA